LCASLGTHSLHLTHTEHRYSGTVLAGRIGMASLKTKGDLAELKVAVDLVQRGYRVAIPFGEDSDFDLILIRDGQLERVQVKYACSDGAVIQAQ
jgi:hypothetical protein